MIEIVLIIRALLSGLFLFQSNINLGECEVGRVRDSGMIFIRKIKSFYVQAQDRSGLYKKENMYVLHHKNNL